MSARILIVEDMEFNIEIASRLLTVQGFQILIAHNGAEAIKLAKEELPDLILMDIGLPDLSGWEVTKILKNTESTKSIPVIALTAHDGEGYEEKLKFSGFSGYAIKPPDYKILADQINSILS